MTSQGHAYTRFKRALKSGNAHLALDAASELQRIGLADALSLLLLIREDEPVLYDKEAVSATCSYTTPESPSTSSTVSAGTTRSPSSGSSDGYALAATTMKPTASLD